MLDFLSKLDSVVALPRGVEHPLLGLLGMTVLIAAFSLGAFHLFSSYQRLERNLSPEYCLQRPGPSPADRCSKARSCSSFSE
jgi:hypothetical protein